MKRMDMELSKKVAEKASKEINEAKRELEDNKDSYIMFLKDVLNDTRSNTKFLKKTILMMFLAIVIMILAIGGVCVYSQNLIRNIAKENTQQIMDFINSTDFYSEIELLNDTSNYITNDMNVNR